jgi:fumarate hydratase subunit alpha
MIREINVEEITSVVKDLCIIANKELPKNLVSTLNCCYEIETDLAKSVLGDLVENIKVAKDLSLPICQDTGMAVVFVEVGQDVHLVGGDFEQAINEGVKQGYLDGLLRLSVVGDPIERINTNSNTPAIIHTSIVSGNTINISVCPKGFGSENMSKIKMFNPSATTQDIIEFVVDVVKSAGSNPCPPTVVGVGIGGDFEMAAILAKKAVCRDVKTRNPKPLYMDLEFKMLNKINSLNIGPQGFGGKTTAFAVNIEEFATHIAGLPVAVNIGCHVTRHASKEI